MASKPNCPFWLECISNIRERAQRRPWYIQGDLKVLWTTGPDLVTEVAKQYTHPFVTIPYRLGHPCTICDHYWDRPCSDDLSFIEELPGSSWSGGLARAFHTLVCQWELFILVIILILLLLLLILVSGSIRKGKPLTEVPDRSGILDYLG